MTRGTQHKKAFTLVELSLTLLLLAVLTAFGIPSFNQLHRKSQLQRVASDLAGTMRYVQERAIIERVPRRLVIDVENQTFWVPIPEEEERRHYRSRRMTRSRISRRRSTRNDRVRETEELQSKLPEGFIFEFFYKVSDDREIRRREGEVHFYPDGSADGTYITILRLANTEEDERRIFIKVSPTTGMIKSAEGHTQRDGSYFFEEEYYAEPR